MPFYSAEVHAKNPTRQAVCNIVLDGQKAFAARPV